MTPTEKDAMALAVLRENADDIGRCATIFRESHMAAAFALTADQMDRASVEIAEARAHLASRIAELEAELAREKDYSAGAANRVLKAELAERKTAARATRAEAELAAVREDAERYRWLKERVATYDGLSLTVAKATGWSLEPWSGDNLDAAIDAARGGE